MAASRWLTIRSGSCGAPCIAPSAGRAKSMKVTIAETGLPGRPKTSVPPRVPNHVGLPGPQGDAPEDLVDAERLRARA